MTGTLATALASAIAAPEAFALPQTRDHAPQEEVPNLRSLTAEDWERIAAHARAAGDSEGAKVAIAEASRLRGHVEPGPKWVAGVAKRAIITAFKHGRSYIPKSFRRYTDKIVHVLETTDVWEQSILTAALMSAGLPPDVAADVARWVSMAI
ncbi:MULTISPECIES: hypothetical protein [Micrococcus]|uniref:hypothetical protein n=1 Tax=Micrococcus TaxID=1269 RepID=UPI000FDACC14|nr:MULTISPECIES: hypothetical protein [Micrococcus]WIK82454.1 hypothetical protein CJ228_001080 [Micrococcus lylae]